MLQKALLSIHGQVIWKPINTNPVVKIGKRFYFSCLKGFFIVYDLWSLRWVDIKTGGQKKC